jgi:hypothetical protein
MSVNLDLFARRGRNGQYPPVADRIDASGDCWVWLGRPKAEGYGQVAFAGINYRAHRFVWQALVGPIPHDLPLDHLCKNTMCVNPDHLQPVTHQENVARSAAVTTKNAAKTECHNGHKFTSVNTYFYADGSRRCKPCHAAYMRKRRRSVVLVPVEGEGR